MSATNEIVMGQLPKYSGVLGGGRMGRSMGGSDNAAEIAAWVADNFAATSVGGTTVYDLTG